jgi:hypothetical protein
MDNSKYVMLFEDWGSCLVLNEDIKSAKLFIQKKFAENKKKKISELTREELDKSLENPGFQKILELTDKNPGYILPFLRFHFDQGIPIKNVVNDEEIQTLEKLQDWLSQKGHLISRLPKSIDQYSLKKNDSDQEVKGFEELADAIRTLELNLSSKWLVDRLPIKPRNEFRGLPSDKQQELFNIAKTLTRLDEDDSEKTITKRLLDKIKAMENYPIKEILDYCNNYVLAYQNVDIQKKMKEISEISPEAGIMYYEFPYLALSIRNEKAQKKLCSIANWCINRGSWNSHAGKTGLQINIFNYSLPPSDPMFLTGTTINYDGVITHSADLNNNIIVGYKKNKEISSLLKSMGYPNELVDVIKNSLPEEIEVKKVLDTVEDYSKSNDHLTFKEKILSLLYGTASKNIKGDMDDKSWTSVVNVVTSILEKENLLKLEDILDFFEENGIFSNSSLMVFNVLFKKHTSSEQRKIIYQSSESIFDQIERLYQKSVLGGSKMESTLKKAESLLKERDSILSKIKEII